MKKILSIFLSVIMLMSSAVFASACTGLKIDEKNISHDVSDMLYGVFLEDISYAVEGGLCANLAANDSFEYPSNNMYAWRTAGVTAEITDSQPMNDNNTHSLKITGSGTVTNIGYVEYYDYMSYTMNEEKRNTPDMGFKAGETYAVSAYFKNVDFTGKVTVYLDSPSNKAAYELDVSDCEDWTKLSVRIPSAASEDGALTFAFEGDGTLYMDFVSVMSESSHGYGTDEWQYTALRSDLYEALYNLSPSFIRFPGGCFAEGDTFDNMFNWKNSIGPLEEREQNYNLWQDVAYGREYNNSYEIGYHEYLQLCEDLDAEPVPVFSAGVLCQGRVWPYQSYKPGTDEFNQLVDDILDFVEYCNGSTDTYWGALRAENGHPDTYNLKYLGIGNENWGEIYWTNFAEMKKIVNEAYPELEIITTSGAWLGGDEFEYAWEQVNSLYPDTIVDEHYYTGGGYLFDNNDRYDSYDREGGQVFVGEYAVTADGVGTMNTKSNLWAAIEEASFMTGFERNSDIVKMTSYAPTFAKLNSQCWTINEIWFDSQEVIYTPSYYVQMLNSNNIGTEYVSTDYSSSGVYQSVTVDREKEIIYVKVVNSSGVAKPVSINVNGFGAVNGANVQYLSSYTKRACNELGSTTIVPLEKDLNVIGGGVSYTAPGYSVNVIRLTYGEASLEDLWSLPEMPETETYLTPAFRAIIDFFMKPINLLKQLFGLL